MKYRESLEVQLRQAAEAGDWESAQQIAIELSNLADNEPEKPIQRWGVDA